MATNTATNTATTVTDKQRKLARKEGGKKGQDLSGLEDMGGVHYFHVALENCEGNWELVQEAMEGANTPVDSAASERKGGAQNIAKAFLSASEQRLCIYLHVPAGLSNESNAVTLTEWFDVLVQAGNATVLETSDEFAKAEVVRKDEVFPLKVRDAIIGQGFAYLNKKGVIPDEDSSDEYEMPSDVEW